MGRKGKTAAKENCESGQKPKRSPNYLPSEKELLLTLVKQRIDVLENKKTDAVSNEERDAGWAALTAEFNSKSGIHERKMESLKDRWDNLKREAKKAAAAEKVETFKTGIFPADCLRVEQRLCSSSKLYLLVFQAAELAHLDLHYQQSRRKSWNCWARQEWDFLALETGTKLLVSWTQQLR